MTHSLAEGPPMLLGEHGGGDEDGDLLTAGHGLEGTADRSEERRVGKECSS